VGATTGGVRTVAALVTDDDDWRWLVEQPDPADDRVGVHAGCLLVLAVCVLLWLLIIAGAVLLYQV
jgi:hypothetical protein